MSQDESSSKKPKHDAASSPAEPTAGEQLHRPEPADLASAWAATEERATDTAAALETGSAFAAGAGDEVDPELVRLSRPRRRRHPLISLAVILLSLYLMYFVRGDLLYFFQPRTPRDVGDVAEALSRGQLQANSYLTVRGAPDRKHAILLKRQLSGWDSFVRLLQSDSRVYVQRHRRKRSTDREVLGIHTGRVVRFTSLPYRETVRAYLERTIHPEHELSFAAIARAKREHSHQVRDIRGGLVTLKDTSELWLNVSYPDEWVVQLAKSIHPSADDARRELGAIRLPYVLADDDSKMFWRFVVIARGKELEQLLRGFSDPGRNAGVIRRQVTYTARWAQLQVDGETLVVDTDEQRLPGPYRLIEGQGQNAAPRLEEQAEQRPLRIAAAALRHASATSHFEMPANAMVVVVGERPASHWPYVLLYSVLGVFILLNGYALTNHWRRRTAISEGGQPKTYRKA